MDPLVNRTPVQVRPADLDTLGHVNNAKYLEYLEIGRTAWYEQVGFGSEAKRRLGLDTVQVNINIDFRQEIRGVEQVLVITRPVERGRTSFVLGQVICDPNDESCIYAEARVTSVVFDPANRQKHPLPSTFATCFPERREAGRS